MQQEATDATKHHGCLRKMEDDKMREEESGEREERETTGQTQTNKTLFWFLPFRVLLIAVSHIFNFTND